MRICTILQRKKISILMSMLGKLTIERSLRAVLWLENVDIKIFVKGLFKLSGAVPLYCSLVTSLCVHVVEKSRIPCQ